MRPLQIILVLCLFAELATLPTWAQSSPAAKGPALLPEACEVDLALSAAPAHLKPEATVYVLKEAGYVRVREGSNGFTCIVNRDHPRVIKPTCFDAEGGATIIPKILRFGERLMQGMPVDAIDEEIAKGFEAGTFLSPRRPGIAYMLSPYNRPYNPSADKLGWFPPHLMFYAPNLSNEDIGVSWEARRDDPRLPFIGYQGPHGYMIVPIEARNRPQDHPLPHCPAWVSADPPGS